MTDQADLAERYDRVADGYARWWAPVLAPSARALLDRFGHELDGRPARLLDIGSGTGTLTVAALERWPTVRVDAIDASREMLAATERAVRAHPGGSDRFAGVTAFADKLPFPDHSFDAAMSSFVLQLVPNRSRALREIRRVLRPGGRLAYVTWVHDRRSWRPDEIVDDVLDDLGIGARDDDRNDGGVAGDLRSAESGAAGLRSAGYRDVRAEAAQLRHAFDPESYTAFIVEFDEQALAASLEPALRRRLVRELRTRLRRLRPDDLVLETPIAYATGRKPDR
jgi:ubiquinone/menaquinone biosynthesis C-methylase UbiE